MQSLRDGMGANRRLYGDPPRTCIIGAGLLFVTLSLLFPELDCVFGWCEFLVHRELRNSHDVAKHGLVTWQGLVMLPKVGQVGQLAIKLPDCSAPQFDTSDYTLNILKY